ncbi:MAG TPA: hypothetical protein VHK47_24425 [Polyangia bacterium]|jgi:hypothetical protein|nr:hypothetical protein [Polyangia bacterium]
MIPYEELDKALARWKARTQNTAVDAAREFEASGAVPQDDAGVLPPPPDRTGEIDIGDSEAVVETLDDN